MGGNDIINMRRWLSGSRVCSDIGPNQQLSTMYAYAMQPEGVIQKSHETWRLFSRSATWYDYYTEQ